MDPLDVFSLLLHPTNTTVPAVSPSDSFFVPFGAQATLLLLFYDYNPVTLESRYGSTVLALSHEHKLDDVLAALFNTVAAVAAVPYAASTPAAVVVEVGSGAFTFTMK